MLLDIFDPEKFLKFGFPGLVAIFALLLFYLFRRQLQGQLTTKDFTLRILPFLIVTLLLLGMAGFSIYTDRRLQNDNLSQNLKHTIDSLNTELLICNGKSPSTKSASNKFDDISHLKDSLDRQIKILQREIKDRNDYLNTNVMISIANSFEEITNHTSSKGGFDPGNHPEFTDKILKNAIFQTILTFGADTSVLRNALIVLKHRGLEGNINQLIQQTPKLLVLKRRWLKGAILQLENAIQKLGPAQESAQINIELPKDVWITNNPYIIHIDESQLGTLQVEKDLLDKVTL
jgi:hypothetical protein